MKLTVLGSYARLGRASAHSYRGMEETCRTCALHTECKETCAAFLRWVSPVAAGGPQTPQTPGQEGRICTPRSQVGRRDPPLKSGKFGNALRAD